MQLDVENIEKTLDLSLKNRDVDTVGLAIYNSSIKQLEFRSNQNF